MNFTPVGASPLTEKASEHKPRFVYWVDSWGEMNEAEVLHDMGDRLVVRRWDEESVDWYYSVPAADGCHATRRDALRAAIVYAQYQVTDANARVNRLIAELHAL